MITDFMKYWSNNPMPVEHDEMMLAIEALDDCPYFLDLCWGDRGRVRRAYRNHMRCIREVTGDIGGTLTPNLRIVK